jgi:3-(3-hydroxy-phenyl)propionate hydroxylase
VSAREEIVVVGAGPTGLTLACQLLRRGVGCRLVDSAPEATQRSRAIGVSARSLEVLAELGAADELVELGLPSRVANFYAGGRRIARLTASAIEHTRYPFLLAVPQSETERVLERHLERLGGTVERGVALRELRQEPGAQAVELTLDADGGAETVEASWVVGADGSHSAVRRGAGIEFKGEATGNVFANVDAVLESPPAAGEGHYYFAAEGLLVIAPLPDDTYRVTALVDPAQADRPLTIEDVQGLVERRADPAIRVRELRDAGWGIARVSIQTRTAERFRAGRCLLAGDAAHIYGPTGAQGMNGGIQDAHNLAWKLALVASGRAGEALLDSYDDERRPVAHEVLHSVEAQTKLATIRSRPGGAARNALLRAVTRAGLLDRGLGPRIMQFDVSYRDAPGVAAPTGGRLRNRDALTGRRLPDVPLEPGEGAARTFDLVGAHGLTALVLGAGRAHRPHVERLAAALGERHGELVALRLVAPAAAPGAAGEPAAVDRHGALHGALGIAEPTVLLVRPDAHVAYRGPLARPSEALSHLDRVLGPPQALGPTTSSAGTSSSRRKSSNDRGGRPSERSTPSRT